MLNAVRCAPIPECIDRSQLARELLAQQFEDELGQRSRRHAHPKFVVIVAPDSSDGGADVLRVHLDRAIVLKRQTYGAKLGSFLAGDFNYVAGHAASPQTIPCLRPYRPGLCAAPFAGANRRHESGHFRPWKSVKKSLYANTFGAI